MNLRVVSFIHLRVFLPISLELRSHMGFRGGPYDSTCDQRLDPMHLKVGFLYDKDFDRPST